MKPMRSTIVPAPYHYCDLQSALQRLTCFALSRPMRARFSSPGDLPAQRESKKVKFYELRFFFRESTWKLHYVHGSFTTSMEAFNNSIEACFYFIIDGSFLQFHGSFSHIRGSFRLLASKILLHLWKLPAVSAKQTIRYKIQKTRSASKR